MSRLNNKNTFMLLSCLISFNLLVKGQQEPQEQRDKSNQNESNQQLRLLVMTVVEDPTSEGFLRFNQSVEAFGLELNVLKLNEAKGNSKFRLIHKALQVHKNEQDLLIMLVNSNNLIINGDKAAIADRFISFNVNDSTQVAPRILFSADSICWPDSSLESNYPLVELSPNETTTTTTTTQKSNSNNGQRFLDSRAFIGYASSLWDFFNVMSPLEPASQPKPMDQELQLYSTRVYLNKEYRTKLAIQLDHRAQLFENLHSTKNDVELEFNLDGVSVRNMAYHTKPVVVHGSGSSRILLNSLGNYLGRAWTLQSGCRNCNSTMISLATVKDTDLPNVLIGVFIEEPTPFMDYFFNHLMNLNYPQGKINIVLHNSIDYHDKQVEGFMANDSLKYASKEKLSKDLPEWEARNLALKRCQQLSCDYYFALDSVAHLELPDTLRILIETNRTIVAPLLSRPRKLWSNFWGSITVEGYYSRSHDYVELVSRERLGVWNAPHIMNCYLIEGKFLRKTLEEMKQRHSNEHETKLTTTNNLFKLQTNLTYYDERFPTVKPVLIFSRNLRYANIYQFVNNLHDFGHLVDPTSFNISQTNPDFYQLENNMIDWERKYLNEKYAKLLENDKEHLESPCQDVYWFPLVNDRFCDHLIEIMETFGKWSGGTNDDPRIEGGYESVPTRDIHFKQVGLHDMWLTFLREYVMPIQLKEYIGYEHDPPRTDLAFVVRYHPAEQDSLRPHHDSSTYTLNIALNTPGVDYEGGGCRFLRYNCSVTESRRGWALIHPGRLTHYHEGLRVTNGTRYILVTFVDP